MAMETTSMGKHTSLASEGPVSFYTTAYPNIAISYCMVTTEAFEHPY